MTLESIINKRECLVKLSHADLIVMRDALNAYDPPIRQAEDVLSLTLGVLNALEKLAS